MYPKDSSKCFGDACYLIISIEEEESTEECESVLEASMARATNMHVVIKRYTYSPLV